MFGRSQLDITARQEPHFLLKFCDDWWRFGRLRKMTKLFLMLDDVTPILLLLGAGSPSIS